MNEERSEPEQGQEHGPAKKMRRIAMRIVTVFVTPIVLLLATECVFRTLVRVTDYPRYFWDPVVGPRRTPNQRGRYIRGDFIDARYNFNAQGWNYPLDYTCEKPRGTRRVCLVGDSYVEALQVDTEESMSCVAERAMSRPDRPVQVFPFGCSGWGTTQELEIIRHYVVNYRPDAIVVVFVQNDPADSSPYIVPIERQIVTYYLDSNDQLELLPAEYWEQPFWRRSQAYSAFARWLGLQRGLGTAIHTPRSLPTPSLETPLRGAAYTGDAHHISGVEVMPVDERRRRTWQLVEASLVRIRDVATAAGARFGLVYRGSYVEIDFSIRPRALPRREEDPFCLDTRTDAQGQEWLEPIARRLGVPYLDLTSCLRAEVARSGQSHCIPGDGHYTQTSHRVAGEALAHWIETWW